MNVGYKVHVKGFQGEWLIVERDCELYRLILIRTETEDGPGLSPLRITVFYDDLIPL